MSSLLYSGLLCGALINCLATEKYVTAVPDLFNLAGKCSLVSLLVIIPGFRAVSLPCKRRSSYTRFDV